MNCTFTTAGDGVYTCSVCGRTLRAPNGNITAPCLPVSCGPGCQLRRTLSWWGIRDDGSCGCSEYAAQMDRWGVAGCLSRLEEIVEHLREQAAAKGLPWIATAARIAVSRAIDAAASEEATHAEKAQAASQTDVGRPAR